MTFVFYLHSWFLTLFLTFSTYSGILRWTISHLCSGLVEMLKEYHQVSNSLDFSLALPYSSDISDNPWLCILTAPRSCSSSCPLGAVMSLQGERGHGRAGWRKGSFGSGVACFSSLLLIWTCHWFCLIQAYILTVLTTADKWGSAGLNTWTLLCYIPTKQLVTYPQPLCFSRNLEPAFAAMEHSWCHSHVGLTVPPCAYLVL